MDKNKGISKNIRMVMLDKDISGSDVADRLDMLPQSFYNLLSRDKMTIAKAEAVADLLGCDIVLQDRNTGKIY